MDLLHWTVLVRMVFDQNNFRRVGSPTDTQNLRKCLQIDAWGRPRVSKMVPKTGKCRPRASRDLKVSQNDAPGGRQFSLIFTTFLKMFIKRLSKT